MESRVRRGQFSIGAWLIGVAAIALLVQPSQHEFNVSRSQCFATAVNAPDGGTLMTGATVFRANATRGTWIDWLRKAVRPNSSALPAQQERRFSPQILIEEEDEVILLRSNNADDRSDETPGDTN
jgi:hypothetical protein